MFGRKKSGRNKVCPNGHVMAASWDSCPYCPDALSAPAGGDGYSTVVLNFDEISGPAGEKQRGGPTVGWIVALTGDHKGEDFRLKSGKNVVGTAADCDIVLSDRKVSRKHCAIRYEGGAFILADLDSSNGSFVNEERVQKIELIDNDLLSLGDTRFKFKSVG